MWWLLSFALSAVFLSHVVAKVLFVTQCVCVLRAISDFLTFFLSFLLFLSLSTSRLNYVRFRTLSLLSSFYFPNPILFHLLFFLLLFAVLTFTVWRIKETQEENEAERLL